MKTSKHLRFACVVTLALLVLSSAFAVCAAASLTPTASAQNADTRPRRKASRKRRPVKKGAAATANKGRTATPRGGVVNLPRVSTDDVVETPPPPPPEPRPTPKKTVVAGGVLNGKAISKPAPEYPAIAKAARASGTVVVQIVVGEDGQVISASAVSGHPLLQSAAVAAARKARFSPTTLSGQPVKVSGVITYNFVLE